MSLSVLEVTGLASVQGAPRRGSRHLGVPWSGPADALSLALGNRLLGNEETAPGIEVAMGAMTLRSAAAVAVAITGAAGAVRLDGTEAEAHRVLILPAQGTLAVTPGRVGARFYVSVAGGLDIAPVLGSPSTYAPAGLGGHEGRALRAGDRLALAAPGARPEACVPSGYRPPLTGSVVLRAVPGPEFAKLAPAARTALFAAPFVVTPRADRMGLRLRGPDLAAPDADPGMASVGVLPGTVQLPPGGEPILLGPDGQTTGGYPRIATVIAADLHLAGQLRPGDGVRFYPRTPSQALSDTRGKARLFAPFAGTGWL